MEEALTLRDIDLIDANEKVAQLQTQLVASAPSETASPGMPANTHEENAFAEEDDEDEI